MILPNLVISSNPLYAIVSFHASFSFRGEASANLIDGQGTWWISRVIVEPESECGKGYGSELLRLLIENVRKQDCKLLLVCPGGYDSNRKQQFNFYKKNGFVMPTSKEIPNKSRKHTLIYRMKGDQK
jgi:tRNA(Met) C34 N-acetyltransferase TmcA